MFSKNAIHHQPRTQALFFVKRILFLIQCCIYRSVPKFASARGFLGRRSPARSQTLVLIYIYNTELSIIFSLQKKRLATRLVYHTNIPNITENRNKHSPGYFSTMYQGRLDPMHDPPSSIL